MRRNLRLDWRALALLGALLSIIIDWPALVYAMPTILPPPMAAEPDEVARTSTATNITKYNEILQFFSTIQREPVTYEQLQQKNTDIQHEFNDNQMRNSLAAKSLLPPTLTSSPQVKGTVTEIQQPPHKRQLTTIDQKQQVNENHNSISDKEINDKKQKEQVDTTATYKAHEHQNSQYSYKVEAIVSESDASTKVSLTNTHTKKSPIKMISLSNSSSTQPTTSVASTTTTTTTTESSAKIKSTLMPTILADQADGQQTSSNSNLNTHSSLNNFKFSSSHHLAILSRNERGIRSATASSSSSSANVSSWGMPLVLSGSNRSGNSRASRSSSAVVNGGRRSFDMGVSQSKRLNNSRNLHHKNNLDRNERSTVSHLSGPSRKIQLYIKNRFMQLLQDGTVNGTQDEQCDYSE